MESSIMMSSGRAAAGTPAAWPWRQMVLCALLGALAAWSLDSAISGAVSRGDIAAGSAAATRIVASLAHVTAVKVLESGCMLVAKAVLWAFTVQGILLLGGWEMPLGDMIGCFSMASLAWVARDLATAALIVTTPHQAGSASLPLVPFSLASFGALASGPGYQIRSEINLFAVGWFVLSAWMLRHKRTRLPTLAAMLVLWVASLSARVGIFWYIARLAGA